MLTNRTKRSIFGGLIFLGLIAATLVVYLNWIFSQAESTKAQLTMQDYAVGTEYAGVITQQYVAVGDNVKQGQLLFKFRSDALVTQLSNGQVKPESVFYALNENNELLITAGKAGRVTKIDYPQGSFVPGNKQVALVADTSTLGVRAEYRLPRADLGRITPDTRLSVELPSGNKVEAKITQVTRTSQNGQDITLVQARVPAGDPNEIALAAGAPVQATIILSDNTYYAQLLGATGKLLDRWLP